MEALNENLRIGNFMERESFWIDSIAVGSEEFLNSLNLDTTMNEVITITSGVSYLRNKHRHLLD